MKIEVELHTKDDETTPKLKSPCRNRSAKELDLLFRLPLLGLEESL
jgi:hypothetical protein